MALRKDKLTARYTLAGTAENGAILHSSVDENLGDFYVKVASVNGGKDGGKAMVHFLSEPNGDKLVTFVREYNVDLSVAEGSANFITQAYVHLKTLPEFAGAVDC